MADRERQAFRFLKKLASGPADAASAEPGVADDLARRGLIAAADGRFTLTPVGTAALRRHLAGVDGFGAQHQSRIRRGIEDPQLGRATVTVNDDESPLSRLRRARGRDGAPLLSAAEHGAGERLRADFTRGQLMPRVTSNWSGSVAGRHRGNGGGMAEMSDAIVAARQRVDRALRAVGPDFAGLLLDFCCFLKGIEEIERERSWPVRSAKLVIRLGLASLARHYGFSEAARGNAHAPMAHWGADDYRPEIDPADREGAGAA